MLEALGKLSLDDTSALYDLVHQDLVSDPGVGEVVSRQQTLNAVRSTLETLGINGVSALDVVKGLLRYRYISSLQTRAGGYLVHNTW